jgi:hypothetical protein
MPVSASMRMCIAIIDAIIAESAELPATVAGVVMPGMFE